jgi:excisionase family DNA binding protein
MVALFRQSATPAYDGRQMPEWLTVNEAAAYLRVSRDTVYTLAAAGRLPYYQIHGVRGRRFKREDLDKLLQQDRPKGGGTNPP